MGLFSDAYGRRLALKISLSGFVLASLACAFAPDFHLLLVARCVQGLMAGAPVVARAMVRDVVSGTEAARLMTLLGAILTIASMFAPVLGSGLLVLFSWRASFLALAILATIFAAYTLIVLQETGGKRRPERFSFGFLAQAGKYLLTTRAFLLPMFAGSLIFGGYASLGAIGAIVTEERYGVSPEAFGALFAIAALVNTGGAFLARALLNRFDLGQVGTIALSLLAVACLMHAGLYFAEPSLQFFRGAVCLYVLAFGMILPTASPRHWNRPKRCRASPPRSRDRPPWPWRRWPQSWPRHFSMAATGQSA
ncbi:MAG: multidrug effflux MFS transporter [Rhodobacteraceae bacterium]|nr:multidrug effflux MFS transporter [Paracoccaceae bacterium]